MNKTTEDIEDVSFKLLSHQGNIALVRHHNFTIPKQALAEGTLFIEIKTSSLINEKNKLKIGVYSGDKLIETTTTNFLSPRKY